MHESKIKILIGDKYTDNPIINYLNYWILGKENRQRYNQDKWRKKYDLDVIWLEGDLNADTIFSLWMPLKMCLQCLNPDIFEKSGPMRKPLKNQYWFKKIIEEIDTYLPPSDDLVKELYKFAELASTKANVMRLPARRMQVRGIKYFDQMPKTLYECFKDGNFTKYFNYNDEEVMEWIKEEKLKVFFEGNTISNHTIKPLIGNLHPSQCKWLKEKENILQMLKTFNEVLTYRSRLIKTSPPLS
ncbi:hypothetical protein EKG37_17565 [Robertmurraya yapensis]|uniref:Uncharacterized protein n=2 Tax=Bacillaceae TaxID=186817 RepID=A0A3S0IA73_9BACI|nr:MULTISPECIES: hypothetical protein [Bacillaceae]RTR28112.1 hypothetical protein EKG37_17565 [Bacillus yapensis]TKC15167.1 hypothetical protein FA727_20005 [Robertmurraya kyonggiensis]TKS94354.1 hypothetical protein FAR12_17565 [Bacillus yapensis]